MLFASIGACHVSWIGAWTKNSSSWVQFSFGSHVLCWTLQGITFSICALPIIAGITSVGIRTFACSIGVLFFDWSSGWNRHPAGLGAFLVELHLCLVVLRIIQVESCELDIWSNRTKRLSGSITSSCWTLDPAASFLDRSQIYLEIQSVGAGHCWFQPISWSNLRSKLKFGHWVHNCVFPSASHSTTNLM